MTKHGETEEDDDGRSSKSSGRFSSDMMGTVRLKPASIIRCSREAELKGRPAARRWGGSAGLSFHK